MNTTEEVNKILEKEQDKMIKYLKWYENLPGNYASKIRLNRKYAAEIREQLINNPDAYPTKLVYILNVNPMDYNKKYPGAVMYENYKMKAYQILYLENNDNITGYDEDIGFSIGLELIMKEFVDNHPQWSELIKIQNKIISFNLLFLNIFLYITY